MGAGNEPISLGITKGEAKSVHLESLYDVRRRIAAVIENAGITGNAIQFDSVRMLVELAITLIPDIEQGEKCRKLMRDKREELIKEYAAENENGKPDADNIRNATGQAAILTLQMVQVIFDEDIGIRIHHTVGVV